MPNPASSLELFGTEAGVNKYATFDEVDCNRIDVPLFPVLKAYVSYVFDKFV